MNVDSSVVVKDLRLKDKDLMSKDEDLNTGHRGSSRTRTFIEDNNTGWLHLNVVYLFHVQWH